MREDWSKVEPLIAGSWGHGCIGAIRGERRVLKARIERVPSSELSTLSVVTTATQQPAWQQQSAFGSKAEHVCAALLSSRTNDGR